MKTGDSKFSVEGTIQAVKTPLGFLTLVVVIANGVIGVAVYTETPWLAWAMIVLIYLLVVIVAVLSVRRPEALSGLRPANTSPAGDLPASGPSVDSIAKAQGVRPELIDPKLVSFIPPLPPTRFRVIGLPRPTPPQHYDWPFAPTGYFPVYGIPFFLIPVQDGNGHPIGHLVVDLQPHRDRKVVIEANVNEIRAMQFLISAGHGWRTHKGVQFLHRKVGYIRLVFSDDTEQRTDLVLGQHLREWAFGNSPNLVTELEPSFAKPAWLSHDGMRRFDLLSIPISAEPKDVRSIEIVAEFGESLADATIHTPSIIVSAITADRG